MPHVLTAAELPVAELLRRAEAWRTRLQGTPRRLSSRAPH
jgi:hypothetical protein